MHVGAGQAGSSDRWSWKNFDPILLLYNVCLLPYGNITKAQWNACKFVQVDKANLEPRTTDVKQIYS